jgi:hypothetical protein
MQAAVRLAADLGVGLEGVYFENVTLLRVAELPFVHEVTRGSGTVRPIDAQSVQRAMQSNAEQARRELQRWADSAKIECSFSVTRERVSCRRLMSTSRSDIIFFGCRSHAPGVRRPMGLRPRVEHPLLLVVSGSPQRDAALEAGTTLVQNHARPVILLVLAQTPEQFRQLSSAASQTLCELQLAHTLLPHPVVTRQGLIRSAHDQRPGLLVISRDCELLDDATLEMMVSHLHCPIVLV